jgi:hypothetical protein
MRSAAFPNIRSSLPGCLPVSDVLVLIGPSNLDWLGLLTVVAEALRRGANLGVVANVATLVTCATRERRHREKLVSLQGPIISTTCHIRAIGIGPFFDNPFAAVGSKAYLSLSQPFLNGGGGHGVDARYQRNNLVWSQVRSRCIFPRYRNGIVEIRKSWCRLFARQPRPVRAVG